MKNSKRPFRDKIFSAIVGTATIGLIVYGLIQRQINIEMLKNHGITEGVVTDFSYSNYHYRLYYKYEVKGVEYKGRKGCEFFRCEDGTKGCVGKKFPVKYAIEDHSISDIDLGKFNKKKNK